jgi:hypothetical protein
MGASSASRSGPGRCVSSDRAEVLVYRIVLVLSGLLLGGLVVAYMVTGNRRYLSIAGQLLLWALALGVLIGLLYLFERVLLM